MMKKNHKHIRLIAAGLFFAAIMQLLQIKAQGAVFIPDPTQAYVSSASSDNNELGLEDEVTLIVTNWAALNGNSSESMNKLLLYVNDMPVRGIAPVMFTIDSTHIGFRYFLGHEAGPIAVWEQLLLTKPRGQFFKTRVKLSLGFENQMPLQTMVKEENGFMAVMVNRNWFYICIATLFALLIVLIIIAAKTDLLRDKTASLPKGKRRPFSLARTQMALWFFIIMASWLLLYVTKHSLNTIPDSMVVLMGISAGTGVGAVALENRNKDKTRYSRGFLKDLIEDDDGVSFHRFQMLAWTIVMLLVFLRQVVSYLIMPEFNASLLVLMGISSGTYLGFKAGEKPGGQAGKENMQEKEPAAGTDNAGQ